MEVGKKYKYKVNSEYVIAVVECLCKVPDSKNFVVRRVDDGYEYLVNEDDHCYHESKEPKKGTVWVNIYLDHETAHGSKKMADAYAYHNRLACIEVHWVEGWGLEPPASKT